MTIIYKNFSINFLSNFARIFKIKIEKGIRKNGN